MGSGCDLVEWCFPILTTILGTQAHDLSPSVFLHLTSIRLGDGDHHSEFLFQFSAWGAEITSLSLSLPSSPLHYSHSRDNLLLVCWKCIPLLIKFTITFTKSLHLAWILLWDARTEVIFRTTFPVIGCIILKSETRKKKKAKQRQIRQVLFRCSRDLQTEKHSFFSPSVPHKQSELGFL
jgi:hypothetical protein